MEERIFNLLSLCMQAQKKGHEIVFDCTSECIYIWHHDPSNEMELIERKYVSCNEDFEKDIKQAEDYLKGLLA